jgi:hypothetical protein
MSLLCSEKIAKMEVITSTSDSLVPVGKNKIENGNVD